LCRALRVAPEHAQYQDTPSALSVFGPSSPVTGNPADAWNLRTASIVDWPHCPSTGPAL
jgi:hypothetical protein